MVKIVKSLDKGMSRINSALKYVCMTLLFFMMVLGTCDVMGRYLFNKPILGTLEIFEDSPAGDRSSGIRLYPGEQFPREGGDFDFSPFFPKADDFEFCYQWFCTLYFSPDSVAGLVVSYYVLAHREKNSDD